MEKDNLPVLRATLEEMERSREKAIGLYAIVFDSLAEARKCGALAAGSPGGLIDMDEKSRDSLMPKYVAGESGNRDKFIAAMTEQTDKAMWAHIIEATDMESLMDHAARNELRESLAKAPPPATCDNVRATLGRFLEDSAVIFQRGIANVFSGLDRRFRSHDGFKIGSRIILDRAFSPDFSGWNHYGRKDELLRDIERTFFVLDGKQQPQRYAGICGQINALRSRSWTVENKYFRVRRFQNGNAHVWFLRADLVRKVNRLLADYYGEAISASADVADVSSMGPAYHVTPAKNFGLFESPPAVVEAVFDNVGDLLNKMVLEPSAGRGRLAEEARRRGAVVDCVEIQNELCATLNQKGFSTAHDDFLKIFPSNSPKYDVVVMNPPFDRLRDCDHVRHALQFLRPGGTLVAVMSASARVSSDQRAVSFRALIDKIQPPGQWSDNRWFDLPTGSFKESGTMVNTCVLRIQTKKQ